jgi:hypothetical protein
VAIDRHRIGVAGVIHRAERRHPDPEALRTQLRDQPVCYFQQEARTVLHAATIAIGAAIGAVLQELVDQVSVCRVQLDAIEAGLLRKASRFGILLHNQRNLIGLERARYFVWQPLESRRKSLARRPDGRSRHRKRAVRMMAGVRNPTHVPELKECETTLAVDGVDDLLPSSHVLFGMDARSPRISLALPGDLRGFGDDQAAATGTLTVILGVQRVRRRTGFASPHSGERRHDHTMA